MAPRGSSAGDLPPRDDDALQRVLDHHAQARRYGRREFATRVGGAFLLTSFAGGLLAACGGDETGATTAEAEAIGGDLNGLMWEGYEDAATVKPFTSANDITVKNEPLATNDEVLTKLKAGGSFDIASPNVAYVGSEYAASVLSPLDLDRIPSTQGYIPRFVDVMDENLTFGGSVYAVPYIWGLDAMLYNTDQIPEPPTTWNDVLKPEYKGKVLMPDSPSANFQLWPRVIGGYDPAQLTQEQLDETTDFLIELKKTQVRTVAGAPDDVADLLARGEVWIVCSPYWSAIADFANERNGEKAAWTFPSEGGNTWIDSLVIPAEAQNEANAYAWIDYVLEPEPQAKFADALYSGTVIEDAVPLVSKENRALYRYDDSEALSEQAPVFTFPPPDSGLTTISDWADAWARVIAS